jgi:acyl carrier protein
MRDSTIKTIEERAELLGRVKRGLITRLSLPFEEADLHDDISLLGSGLGLDSLDALEVILGLEQEFGVKVAEDNVSVLRSINSVVDYLLEERAAGRIQ